MNVWHKKKSKATPKILPQTPRRMPFPGMWKRAGKAGSRVKSRGQKPGGLERGLDLGAVSTQKATEGEGLKSCTQYGFKTQGRRAPRGDPWGLPKLERRQRREDLQRPLRKKRLRKT